MKRMIASGLALSCFLLPISAQEPSSVENTPESKSEQTAETVSESEEENYNVTELQEFVVESSRLQIVNEGVVVTPTKSEKNTSNNASTLIDRMDIGLVYVEQGNIKARTGDGNVNIFINGIPADEMDLATFWPSNAQKVEFYPSSSDPRFMGKSNVLNFVMKVYEIGGLTQFEGQQQFPNTGRYKGTSKFEYKDMSYNLLLSGSYDRDHQGGYEKEETFSDIWYDGKHYEEVKLNSRSEANVSRYDDLYAGLNARYLKGKYRITHSASLKWNRNPESYENGTVAYSPSIITGDIMTSLTRSRLLNLFTMGKYDITLNNKWSIESQWKFIHSHTNNFSNYQQEGLSDILNSARENFYRGELRCDLSYKPNSKLSFFMLASGIKSWYVTDYAGSVNARQDLQKDYVTLWGGMNYRPLSNLTLRVNVQGRYQSWHLSGLSTSDSWTPGVSAGIEYNKNKIGMFRLYLAKEPDNYVRPSSLSSIIIRQTELTWLEGNPNPKMPTNYNISFSYFNQPLKWLGVVLQSHFYASSNQEMKCYIKGGEQYDGVIAKYMDSGSSYDFWLNAGLNFRIIGNKLRFKTDVRYFYTKYTESPLKPISRVGFYPSLVSNLGNHSIYINYRSPFKSYTNGGYSVYRQSGDYALSYSYGNGNLYLSVNIENIFQKHLIKTVTEENGPYKMVSRTWQTGRNVSVSLSYTFDYGKKVTPYFDIYEEKAASTSVLGK